MVYNLQNVNRKNQITGAIRRGYWKLVKTKHKMIMYNLKDDPREQKNVAAYRQDIINQLNLLITKCQIVWYMTIRSFQEAIVVMSI